MIWLFPTVTMLLGALVLYLSGRFRDDLVGTPMLIAGFSLVVAGILIFGVLMALA